MRRNAMAMSYRSAFLIFALFVKNKYNHREHPFEFLKRYNNKMELVPKYVLCCYFLSVWWIYFYRA